VKTGGASVDSGWAAKRCLQRKPVDVCGGRWRRPACSKRSC